MNLTNLLDLRLFSVSAATPSRLMKATSDMSILESIPMLFPLLEYALNRSHPLVDPGGRDLPGHCACCPRLQLSTA